MPCLISIKLFCEKKKLNLISNVDTLDCVRRWFNVFLCYYSNSLANARTHDNNIVCVRVFRPHFICVFSGWKKTRHHINKVENYL